MLFDCPPGIGLPMTLAMIAGDRFMIPTKLERFALHGTGRLFSFIDRLIELHKRSAEPMASILGILLTDLNYQFVDAAEREAEIRNEYGTAVFDTVIRRNLAKTAVTRRRVRAGAFGHANADGDAPDRGP